MNEGGEGRLGAPGTEPGPGDCSRCQLVRSLAGVARLPAVN